jgi:hypothetical protein
VALIVNHGLTAWSSRLGWTVPAGLTWQRVLLGLLMFHVTCLGMLIFRAESMSQIAQLLRVVLTNLGPGPGTASLLIVPFFQVVLPFLAVHAYQAVKRDETAPLRLPVVPRYALYGAVFYLVLLFGDFEGAQFIYFQF